MMFRFIVLALSVLCFTDYNADAAGMNTHTYVAYRTAKFFGKVTASPNASRYNAAISNNLPAVLGGSDFPDFGYACGGNNDAGEAAHWPAWHGAAVNYLRQKTDFVSGEWSDETQKLVAFLFGASVHYIADEFFEGLTGQLGRGQGFVETLGAMNLNNSGMGDNSENVANIGGDFFVSWAFDEKQVHPWSRYFPLEDIVEIYKLYNNSQFPKGFPNVTVSSLLECKVLFDLGAWAEITFGPLLYELYTKDSPFIGERYLDLPTGGMDDMAVWASFEWERIAHWLDVGAPDDIGPRRLQAQINDGNTPSIETNPTFSVSSSGDDHDASENWAKMLMGELSEFRAEADALLALDGAGSWFSWVNHHHPWEGISFNGPNTTDPSVKKLLSQVLSSMLSLLPVGDSDQIDVAAASAPTPLSSSNTRIKTPAYRRVLRVVESAADDVETKVDTWQEDLRRLWHGQSKPSASPPSTSSTSASHNQATAAASIEGSVEVGYLGTAMCSGDFDGDGKMDVAAGAYGTGTPGRPQVGSVTVMYGAAATAVSTLAWNSSNRSVTLHGTVIHGRFGYAVTALDFNQDGVDDLAVAAPLASWAGGDATEMPNDATPYVRNRGQVYIFFGTKGVGLLPGAPPDVMIKTSDDLTVLGSVLFAHDVNGDGHSDLLIGCPLSSWVPPANSSNPDAYIHRGALMGFLSSKSAWARNTTVNDARQSADLHLQGPTDYAWFGQSAAVVEAKDEMNTKLLVVGAPFFRGTNGSSVGRVFAYDLTRGVNATTLPLRFTLTGIEHPAEFGWSISAQASVNGTAPLLAIASQTAGRSGKSLRGGEVRLFRVDSALLALVDANIDPDTGVGNLKTSEVPLQALLVGQDAGRLGSHVQFSPTGNLVVGAPLSSPLAKSSFGLLGPRDAGALFVFSNASIPHGVITDVSKAASKVYRGSRTRARLGSSWCIVSDEVSQQHLFIGSPHADANDGREMTGVIDIFDMVM